MKSEQEALLILHKRIDIIITKADKGGAVVILDIKEAIEPLTKLTDNLTTLITTCN